MKNQCIMYTLNELNFMVPELHLINNLNSLGFLATELVASHAALMMLGQGILKACFERGFLLKTIG